MMHVHRRSRETLLRQLHAGSASIRIGTFSLSLHVDTTDSLEDIADLYAHYPSETPESACDFRIRLRAPNVWRGFYRPQIQAFLDGESPFAPAPLRLAVPMLESAINWSIFKHTTRYLLLHAAVLEYDGMAVVLPGISGAGKSTLCAGLIADGWRLLSDEFAMVRPEDVRLQPHPRPVSLKNESIDEIARRFPNAHFSTRFRGTAKGTVAYMRAPEDAVVRADEPAKPAFVIAPRFAARESARLETVGKAQAFMQLVRHSPNYFMMMKPGFETLANLVETCDHYTLRFGALDDAVATINQVRRNPRGNAPFRKRDSH